MGKYLKKFNNHTEYEQGRQILDLPNVSLCVQENEVHYNPFVPYSERYLTFVALEDGTFKFTKMGSGDDIQYSIDGGTTWTRLASETNTPTVTASSKILWKGELNPTGQYPVIGRFSSTSRFNVEGNPMSLLFGDNFKGNTSLSGKNGAFNNLFYNCTKLVSAKNLILLATTLANYCYSYMFDGCTSLTEAPELPATTLANYCYEWMFASCSSLTTAPELPATTLQQECYNRMFLGCTNLNYIKCLATNISASNCTDYWVNGVSSSGTFVKSSSMTSWTTSVSGIPSGWTVEDA